MRVLIVHRAETHKAHRRSNSTPYLTVRWRLLFASRQDEYRRGQVGLQRHVLTFHEAVPALDLEARKLHPYTKQKFRHLYHESQNEVHPAPAEKNHKIRVNAEREHESAFLFLPPIVISSSSLAATALLDPVHSQSGTYPAKIKPREGGRPIYPLP